MGEYEAGKEKNHSILTTKKLDYTTDVDHLQSLFYRTIIVLET